MNSFTGIIHHRLKPPHAPPHVLITCVKPWGVGGGLPAMTKHQNFKLYQKVTEGELNRKEYNLFGYDKSKNNLLLENMEEKI